MLQFLSYVSLQGIGFHHLSAYSDDTHNTYGMQHTFRIPSAVMSTTIQTLRWDLGTTIPQLAFLCGGCGLRFPITCEYSEMIPLLLEACSTPVGASLQSPLLPSMVAEQLAELFF